MSTLASMRPNGAAAANTSCPPIIPEKETPAKESGSPSSSLTGASGSRLFEEWQAEFKPLLGKSPRWEGFSYLMRDLVERPAPVVLETGTLREPGNWLGDGQSTRIWEWLMEHKHGCAISVDQDAKACELARRECGKVLTVCQDSVSFLRGFLPFAVDLLYLDTLEWGRSPGDEVDCWMHQAAELSAVWSRLPSGCLIASDDNQDQERGKPVLTRLLFQALGMKPVLNSYIIVWKKP